MHAHAHADVSEFSTEEALLRGFEGVGLPFVLLRIQSRA